MIFQFPALLFALLCLLRRRRVGRIAGLILLCGFFVWVTLLWMQPAFMDG